MANKRPKVFVSKTEYQGPVEHIVEAVEAEKPSETFHDEFPLMTTIDLPTIAETHENITLSIPQHIYDEYARVAKQSDMSVEELMQHRLASCKSHNALRGVWFSDSERGQLENILQKWPIESASQVLKLLVKNNTVSINGEEIVLSPAQKRVLSLAMYGGRTPKTFFEAMIRKELRT